MLIKNCFGYNKWCWTTFIIVYYDQRGEDYSIGALHSCLVVDHYEALYVHAQPSTFMSTLHLCPTFDPHELSTFMLGHRPYEHFMSMPDRWPPWALYVHARPSTLWALYLYARLSTSMSSLCPYPNIDPYEHYVSTLTVDPREHYISVRLSTSWAIYVHVRPSTPISTLRPYPTINLMSTLRPC